MFLQFPSFLYDTPCVHEAPQQTQEGLTALFLDSVPYAGRPTRVFGYYGLPTDTDGLCPAVLLLHGGGGTAFPDWVRLWNARGYAALALDLEGHYPLRAEPAHVELESHAFSGPARQGEFADIDLPVEEQWMYHAVAAAIVGISFLRTQSGIDPTRVGVNGISWGGMVTANLLCADSRLAFAIPAYGCGALGEGATYFAPVFQQKAVADLWECCDALPHVTTPTLWLNGACDMHFPPDATARCHRAMPHSRMLLLPDLGHGYDGAAWEVPEVYAFADAVCGRGLPLPQFNRPFDGGVTAPDGVVITEAVLQNAPDGLRYPEPERRCETTWQSRVIGLDQITATNEADGVSFVNVTDDRGLRVTSPLFCDGTYI